MFKNSILKIYAFKRCILYQQNLFKLSPISIHTMNKWLEILIGLILVIGMILIGFYSESWVVFGKSLNFLTPAWIVLKGGIFWFVLMIGLLLIMLGISDLKG